MYMCAVSSFDKYSTAHLDWQALIKKIIPFNQELFLCQTGGIFALSVGQHDEDQFCDQEH